jgi:hypothetical protein
MTCEQVLAVGEWLLMESLRRGRSRFQRSSHCSHRKRRPRYGFQRAVVLDLKCGDITVKVVRRIEEVLGRGDLWRIELDRRSGGSAAAGRKR